MENSHLVIFDEIWLMTLYSTGCLARFLSNLVLYATLIDLSPPLLLTRVATKIFGLSGKAG